MFTEIHTNPHAWLFLPSVVPSHRLDSSQDGEKGCHQGLPDERAPRAQIAQGKLQVACPQDHSEASWCTHAIALIWKDFNGLRRSHCSSYFVDLKLNLYTFIILWICIDYKPCATNKKSAFYLASEWQRLETWTKSVGWCSVFSRSLQLHGLLFLSLILLQCVRTSVFSSIRASVRPTDRPSVHPTDRPPVQLWTWVLRPWGPQDP